jgi:hypothetical protein
MSLEISYLSIEANLRPHVFHRLLAFIQASALLHLGDRVSGASHPTPGCKSGRSHVHKGRDRQPASSSQIVNTPVSSLWDFLLVLSADHVRLSSAEP